MHSLRRLRLLFLFPASWRRSQIATGDFFQTWSIRPSTILELALLRAYSEIRKTMNGVHYLVLTARPMGPSPQSGESQVFARLHWIRYPHLKQSNDTIQSLPSAP
ncbi:hypothetical protein BDV18DRAFT_2677 [Aspergillus unguis]